MILGSAFRSSSLSFSVGVRPSFSSALSDRKRPAPAYAMMPAPIMTRVLGAIALYHLKVSIGPVGRLLGDLLPDSHVGVVFSQCVVDVGWTAVLQKVGEQRQEASSPQPHDGKRSVAVTDAQRSLSPHETKLAISVLGL